MGKKIIVPSMHVGHLQGRLLGGDFNPYDSHLGDGAMAKLAALELLTGKDVPVPKEVKPEPTKEEKVFDLLRQLISLVFPQELIADPADRPHWKFRRGKWVDPDAKKKKPRTRKTLKKRKR